MNIKLNLFAAAMMLTGMYSCTQSQKVGSESTSKATKPDSTSIKGCYLYTVNQDTFQLAITAVKGKQAEGSLMYNFAEKDDSKGTFTGTYENGVLKAEFTFASEGKSSVSQVIFKKTGKGFIQGSGETRTENGKEVFSSPDAVSYQNGIEFTHNENCLP